MSTENKRWAKLAGIPEQPKKQQLDERFGEIKIMDRGDHLLIRGIYPSQPNTSVKITPANGLTMDDIYRWKDELIQIAQQKTTPGEEDWSAGIIAGEDGEPTISSPRGGTDEPYYIFTSFPATSRNRLNENIGGVVSIGAINNLFDREKEKYEDAFEHFLAERYEEKVEENYASEVRDAWPSLDIDTRVNLLLSVYDDPDMAEMLAEKDFDSLPEAAKANMRMDMLEETSNPFEYERGIVQKVIRQTIEDMSSNTALNTREYIDEIINSLEELKISDF